MDSQEAGNFLMEFFKKNDYYESSKHFDSVVLITEDRDADMATMEVALDRFEEIGITKPKKINEKVYHILTRPIDAWEQHVEVNYHTAVTVAECLNSFCDVINDHKDRCDSSQLQPKDIHNLTFIIQHYRGLVESIENDIK